MTDKEKQRLVIEALRKVPHPEKEGDLVSMGVELGAEPPRRLGRACQ